MPWEKKFDKDLALDMSMQLFWQKGYYATSIADLVATTGASRYGLYNVFGDKKQLFLRALDRYRDTVVKGRLGNLLLETASITEIRAYFECLIAIAELPEIRYGCLMCSTAIGLAFEDEEIRHKIHDYFNWLSSLFERALQNAIAREEISASTNISELALYLTGLVQGGAVFARSSIGSSAIATYFRTGLQTIFPD